LSQKIKQSSTQNIGVIVQPLIAMNVFTCEIFRFPLRIADN